MAQRRMFSPDIVCSDAFLDMPASSQALYYSLGMYADDDGFINPRKIMRMLGASEDDLKILLAKRFLIAFPDGVMVIKHWRMNNLVRKDWYRPTLYTEHKSTLYLKQGGGYTLDPSQGQPLVNEPLTKSLTEVRLGKVNKAIAKPIALLPSEVTEVRLTTEGDEKAPKVKRDMRVWYLRDKLYKILEDNTGVAPTPHIGDYKQVQLALTHLKEDEVEDLFENALSTQQIRTVRQALTARQIDSYRQDNA